jgi:hypothetical protein
VGRPRGTRASRTGSAVRTGSPVAVDADRVARRG